MSISIVNGEAVRYNPLTGDVSKTDVIKENKEKVKEKIEDVIVDEAENAKTDKKKTSK